MSSVRPCDLDFHLWMCVCVHVCAWVCLFTCVSLCMPVGVCGCMHLYVCCEHLSITSTHAAMTEFSTRLNKVIHYMITNWVNPERHVLEGNHTFFFFFNCIIVFAWHIRCFQAALYRKEQNMLSAKVNERKYLAFVHLYCPVFTM